MSKAKPKTKRPRVPKAKRAQAAAAVLVDGKSNVQAAQEAGTSEATVRRVLREVGEDESLASYVEAYRAKALPAWLGIVDAAAEQTLRALPGAEARDAAVVAKTFSEMAQRAAGEADVKHEHTGDLAGARDALAQRLAALAPAGDKSGGPG